MYHAFGIPDADTYDKTLSGEAMGRFRGGAPAPSQGGYAPYPQCAQAACPSGVVLIRGHRHRKAHRPRPVACWYEQPPGRPCRRWIRT